MIQNSRIGPSLDDATERNWDQRLLRIQSRVVTTTGRQPSTHLTVPWLQSLSANHNCWLEPLFQKETGQPLSRRYMRYHERFVPRVWENTGQIGGLTLS